MVVMVALIMCGVAPAKPAAIIVIYSSMLACTKRVLLRDNELHKKKHTFTGVCVVFLHHPLHVMPLDDTTIFHFPPHGNEKTKCGRPSAFSWFLSGKDSFRYEAGNQMQGR